MAELDTGNTEGNTYTGTPVALLNTEAEEALEIPALEVTPGDENKYTFFKHKMIARFEIPRGYPDGTPKEPFVFKNHIARIPNNLVDEFLEACSGLHGSDIVNIVKLKNVSNESPILKVKPSTIRGPTQTADLKPSQMPGGSLAAPSAAPTLKPIRLAGAHIVDTTPPAPKE